jgi:hypothetical protein
LETGYPDSQNGGFACFAQGGFVKTLRLFVVCLTLGSAFVFGQLGRASEDVVELVSRVKDTPASQIDPALPPVALEKWLASQAGADAAIAWVLRTADGQGHGISLVEADVSLHGRPLLVIMIAAGAAQAGTRPTFRSLQLIRAGDYAEWHRLRDFRAALKRARHTA